MTYNHAGNLSLLPSDFFVRFSGYKFIEKLVLIRARVHPFPSRTRKLSSLLPTILGWRRPGKIGSANTKAPMTKVMGALLLLNIVRDAFGTIP